LATDKQLRKGASVSKQHQTGLCRFEPGGLDSVFPNLRLNENQTLFYAKYRAKFYAK